MKCKKCGIDLQAADYCPKCGTKTIRGIVRHYFVFIVIIIITIIGSAVILLTGSKKENTLDTHTVDMTDPNGNTEYGGICYNPIDEAHVVSLTSNPYVKYIDNEILIVVRQGTAKNEVVSLAQKYGFDIVGEIEITGDYQLKARDVMSENDIAEMVEKLSSEGIIESASLNYVSEISPSKQTEECDGFYYGKKWQGDLQNFNDAKGKSWGLEAISTTGAWDKLTHTSRTINPVKIGLIDVGFDANHEDLEFAEVFYDSGANGLSASDVAHGTHVAGTMAAKNNDRIGICGIYPYGAGRLYGVSNCNNRKKQPQGALVYNNSLIADKVSYAELIVRNVKVINNSRGFSWYKEKDFNNWYDKTTTDSHFKGFNECSDYLGDFFQKFLDKGYDFVIVSSAGNNSRGLPTKFDSAYNSYLNGISQSKYPDVYDRIIVVGSVNKKMQVSSFSDGGDRVDIYAPGEDIFSTWPNNKYKKDSGTSMAAPHVAGVAAMVWSANNSLTGAEVKEALTRRWSGRCTSCHMIDAYMAVSHALGEVDTGIDPNAEYGVVMCYVVDRVYEDKIVDANVMLRNIDTGEEYTTMTDALGHFEIMLPEGSYSLTVTADGFEDYEWPDGNNYQNPIVVRNEGINYLDDWIKMTRIGKEEIQLNVFAIDADTLNPITNKDITLTLSNAELVCNNPKQMITTVDGSVIFDISMGKKNRLVDSKVILHIDGYNDFTLDSFQFGNDPASMQMFEALFTKNEESPSQEDFDIDTYYEYISQNLVPQYGLASIDSDQNISEVKGIVSAHIYDYTHDGNLDMLLASVSSGTDGSIITLQLFTVRDTNVELLDSYTTSDPQTDYDLYFENGNIYINSQYVSEVFGIMGWGVSEVRLAVESDRLVVKSSQFGSVGAPPVTDRTDQAILLGAIQQTAMSQTFNERKFQIHDYTDLRSHLSEKTIDVSEQYYQFIANELIPQYGLSQLIVAEMDWEKSPDYSGIQGVISASIKTIESRPYLLTLIWSGTKEKPQAIVELYEFDHEVKKIDTYMLELSEYTVYLNVGWAEDFLCISDSRHFNYVSSSYGNTDYIMSVGKTGFNKVFALNSTFASMGYHKINDLFSDKIYFESADGSDTGFIDAVKSINMDLANAGFTNYSIKAENGHESFGFDINYSESTAYFYLYDSMIEDYTDLRSHIPSTNPSQGDSNLYQSGGTYSLVGTIQLFTGYNAQNQPEECYELLLDNAVTVQSDSPDSQIECSSLQLAYDAAINIQEYVGKNVTVSGQLFEAHTAHHHRDWLISVESIDNTEIASISPSASFSVKISPMKRHETYSVNNGEYYFTLDSTVPQFEYSVSGYEEQQNRLNNTFANIQQSFANSFIEHGCQIIDSQSVEDNPNITPDKKTWAEEDYSVELQTSTFCTLNISKNGYWGGAHTDGGSLESYLIDFTSGAILGLDELVSSVSDFKFFVADYFLKTYASEYSHLIGWNQNNLINYFSTGQGNNWYIQDDTLFVFYGVYELGMSWADGSQTLGIPISECIPYFNERGKQLFGNTEILVTTTEGEVHTTTTLTTTKSIKTTAKATTTKTTTMPAVNAAMAHSQFTQFYIPIISDKMQNTMFLSGYSTDKLLSDGLVYISIYDACDLVGGNVEVQNEEGLVVNRSTVTWSCELSKKPKQYMFVDDNAGRGNYFEAILENTVGNGIRWNREWKYNKWEDYGIAGVTRLEPVEANIPVVCENGEMFVSLYHFTYMFGTSISIVNTNVEMVTNSAMNLLHLASEKHDALEKTYAELLAPFHEYDYVLVCFAGTPADELYQQYFGYDKGLQCDFAEYYSQVDLGVANIIRASKDLGITSSVLALWNLDLQFDEQLINALVWQPDAKDINENRLPKRALNITTIMFDIIGDGNDFDDIKHGVKTARLLDENIIQMASSFNLNFEALDFAAPIPESIKAYYEYLETYQELSNTTEDISLMLDAAIIHSPVIGGKIIDEYTDKSNWRYFLPVYGGMFRAADSILQEKNSVSSLVLSAKKTQEILTSSEGTAYFAAVMDGFRTYTINILDTAATKTVDAALFGGIPFSETLYDILQSVQHSEQFENCQLVAKNSNIADLDDYVFIQDIVECSFDSYPNYSNDRYLCFLLDMKATMLAYQTLLTNSPDALTEEKQQRLVALYNEALGVQVNRAFYNFNTKIDTIDLTDALGNNGTLYVNANESE